jgi:hypothetical protein
MNRIAIGDGIPKDEIGLQDGDESNEENGRQRNSIHPYNVKAIQVQ